MKLVTTALLTMTLCVGTWSMRNTDVVRSVIQATSYLPAPLRIGDGLSTNPSLGRPGVHKCLKGKDVLYTSESCPKGAEEQAPTQGTLSVVPGQSEAKLPKLIEQVASPPTVRDLLAPEGEKSLRDQWMDKVIGQ